MALINDTLQRAEKHCCPAALYTLADPLWASTEVTFLCSPASSLVCICECQQNTVYEPREVIVRKTDLTWK